MKRKVMALLTAALLLAGTVLPVNGVWAEEELELTVSGGEQVQTKGDDLSDLLDQIINNNASIMGSLGQTDWNAVADSVVKTGKWRDDLVAVAQTQEGYRAEANGDTIYTQWAEQPAGTAWDAMFVSWAAEKAGLTEKQFPRGNSFDELKAAMKKVGAVKEISRANYPNTGDVALLKVQDAEIAGVVAYVSNGYAAVIHARNGEVVRETYLISGAEFQQYVDMNVLMERAGLESGKGGEAPVIPEGGVAAWTNTNAVYLRKEPTTASKSLTTVKKSGTALLVVSAEKQEDGYIWYGVEYKSYKGYIRGDLLKLDMAAVTVPSQAPEAPEAPEQTEGCAYCKAEAGNVVLPVECCYEHLAKLGTEYAVLFMNALRDADQATWGLYVKCHDAHVQSGAEQIIPLGGLSVQDRVVNVEIKEAAAGQQITITFDVYNAQSYQWYEAAEEGSEAVLLEGEEGASLTVIANAETNGKSYYCVATMLFNGSTLKLTSKLTTVNVDATPVMAEAIAGEEVKFTYENENAVSYQWYGPVKSADGSCTSGLLSGETAATLTTTADIAVYKSGVPYYCEALDANGNVLSTSGSYAYTILAGEEYLDLYIAELTNMSRVERYIALTETWRVELSEITGVAEDADVISEHVMLTWYGLSEEYPGLRTEYPDLLCTCIGSDTVEVPNGLLLHPHDTHDAACPWYTPAVKMTSTGPSTEDTTVDLTVFYDCEAFPTECAMISGWVANSASPMAIYNDLLSLQGKPGYTLDGYEYDMYFAALMHTAAHEGVDALLCSCVEDMYSSLIAPGDDHAEECAWHIAGVDGEQLASRVESEPEFTEWMEKATQEMIVRALQAKTLDHLVVDNGALYVAREESPRATVDESGYVRDNEYDIIIAQIIDGVFVPLWQLD